MTSTKFLASHRNAFRAALVSAAVLGGAFISNAQAAEATSVATSTVIVPIAITAPQVLSFGKFAPGVGGTIKVGTDGVRETSGVIKSGLASTASAARFVVTGDNNATYAITHSGVAELTGPTGSTPMALAKISDLTQSTATTTNVLTGTLSASGTQTIYVGGTLTVGATQAVGTYTGNVTVAVEYN